MEDSDYFTYQESKAIVTSGFDLTVYHEALKAAHHRRIRNERTHHREAVGKLFGYVPKGWENRG